MKVKKLNQLEITKLKSISKIKGGTRSQKSPFVISATSSTTSATVTKK